MGLSENSVPLNPMVNDHYPQKNDYFIGNINPTFSDKPTSLPSQGRHFPVQRPLHRHGRVQIRRRQRRLAVVAVAPRGPRDATVATNGADGAADLAVFQMLWGSISILYVHIYILIYINIYNYIYIYIYNDVVLIYL